MFEEYNRLIFFYIICELYKLYLFNHAFHWNLITNFNNFNKVEKNRRQLILKQQKFFKHKIVFVQKLKQEISVYASSK